MPYIPWYSAYDNDVITSGIFEIAMTNTSWKTVKIRRNTNMGLLKSCIEEEICTIHEIITLEKPEGEKKSKEKKVKRMYMQSQLETIREKLK